MHVSLPTPLPLRPPDWLNSLFAEQREIFDARVAEMHDTLVQISQDGLHQLRPIVLASQMTPAELRQEVGRAAWRKIHHGSEQTNFLRALVWLRFEDDASWAEIADIPEVHLRSCRNALDWRTAKVSSRLAEPGRFQQVSMLAYGVAKMGGDHQLNWSLVRLKREHAKLSARAAISDADPTPCCTPIDYEIDGFAFSRLTSDRDFVIESKAQRHCVASMCEEALDGTAVVFRCTGAERATLRVGRDGSFELAGFANAAVSAKCEQAARVVQQRTLQRLFALS